MTRTWKLRNQILESRIENVRMWSMNGFAFLAVGGTPNIWGNHHKPRVTRFKSRGKLTCVNTSFVNRPHSVSSNPLSKLNSPRLPFRQFPVIFSSSIVCTFCTCSLMLGPFGVFAAHMYKSSCRRASKYSALLQLLRSASSGKRWSWDFESSFESARYSARKACAKHRFCRRTFFDMGQESFKIIHKMSHSMRDASRRQHKHSLLVSLFRRWDDLLINIHIIRLSFSFSFGLYFDRVRLLCF